MRLAVDSLTRVDASRQQVFVVHTQMARPAVDGRRRFACDHWGSFARRTLQSINSQRVRGEQLVTDDPALDGPTDLRPVRRLMIAVTYSDSRAPTLASVLRALRTGRGGYLRTTSAA